MSRKILAPLILFASVSLLMLAACGGSAPAATSTEQPPVASATQEIPETPEPIAPSAPTPEPAIPEQRLLTLEFPPRIRVGDSDIVRLTLSMDSSGNITPTAVIQGNVVNGKVIEIPNLYDSHHVIAEAKFDIAGVQISPADLSSQTLLPGQSVMFFWSVRPTDIGIYRGTVWLFLRFVDKTSGEETRNAISAQSVEIEAVTLFGISANVARSVGVVGSVLGAVVGFPFFEEIVKFLFKRKQQTK